MDMQVWRDLLRSRAESAREVSAELCEESARLRRWAAASRDTRRAERAGAGMGGARWREPLMQPVGGSVRQARSVEPWSNSRG